MKAAINTVYGGPDVVTLGAMPDPKPGKDEVLVRVMAAGVTTADWRLRAAAFPGGMGFIGRLMFGIFAPRNPVLGGDFAGEVVQIGADVTEFPPGDRVVGFSAKGGAHAEYLTVRADAAIAPIPDGLSYEEAAALPFGAMCARAFLQDFGALKAGEKVLIVGASGGVGVYATQVAHALGATVTAVASAANHELVRSLGANHVIDYKTAAYAEKGDSYDLIFDTVGALGWPQARRALSSKGRFLPLNFSIGMPFRALWSKLWGGRRLITTVNGDTRASLDAMLTLVARGALRPVIDRVFPFEEIKAAHALVEGRRRKGAIVLTIGDAGFEDARPRLVG